MSYYLIFIPKALALIAIAIVGVWLLVKILMGLGWVVGNAARGVGLVFGRLGSFIGGMVGDACRLVGGLVTGVAFVPLTIFNIALGRWSAANHYGKALEREAVGVGAAAYRLTLGHISKLLGLTSLTEGIERRIPDVMRRAPGPDSPVGRPDAFEGFTVVGSLPSGGSGARLFLAEPNEEKQERYRADGVSAPNRVVIKSFTLGDGSTMPQIVRESRALEAARNLGLVLEHELSGGRFHYVMPYVPGQDLNIVTQRLHDESGAKGLGPRQLDKTLGFAADLLQIVHRFHSNGLWHKDIKPNNIIVSEGRVHLVDLGLITPLASAMTLTTHGTEYFRDPELVRLALRGVKVNEVDGVKFDIYAVGAVLYSMIENSFPAHGNLSQIKARCPEALRWIVRRAMADIENRYPTAVDMLADLRTVIASRDPHRVKPAQLPSVLGDPDLVSALGDEISGSFGSDVHNPPPLDMGSPSRIRNRETTQPATRRRGGLAAGVVAASLLGTLLLGFFMVGSEVGQFQNPGIPQSQPLQMSVFPGSNSLSKNTHANSPRRLLPERHWAERRPEPSVVLIVDDVPEAASDEVRRQVDEMFGLLEQAHFELVVGSREHSLPDDLAIDLNAKARATIGLGDPRNDDTAERLSSFLSAHKQHIDAVLWLGRDEHPDDIVYQVVCPDADDLNDLRSILQPSKPAPDTQVYGPG
jgi:serine/threonine protein kinase